MMKEVISRRRFIEQGIFRPGLLVAMTGFAFMTASACNRGAGNKDGAADPAGAGGPGSAGGGENTNGQAGTNDPAAPGDPAEGAGSQTGGDPCTDLSGVSEAEIQKRESFGYVEQSPIPDKQCKNCNLWLPPGGDHKCGACTLFKGPVKDEAYCTYWAPQV